jgi:hypothetical protein
MPSHEQLNLQQQLDEAQKRLNTLLIEAYEQDFFDSSTQKKMEIAHELSDIIKKLNKITQGIESCREAINNETIGQAAPRKDHLFQIEHKLRGVVASLQQVVLTIPTLNAANQNDTKDKIENLNSTIGELNGKIQNYTNTYQDAAIQFTDCIITTISYGESISGYMSLAMTALKKAMMLWLTYSEQLEKALETVEVIFPPIIWSLNALAKFFNFVGIAAKSIHVGQAKIKSQDSEYVRELAEAEAFLKTSALAKFTIFGLHLLTVLAFAGVLATPLGWIFIAVSAGIEWFDEKVRPFWRAQKEYAEVEKSPTMLPEQLNAFKAKRDAARLEVVWGIVNVVAMTLIACGPIPFVGPFLGLAGLGLFGLVSVRNVIDAGLKYRASRNQTIPTTAEQEEVAIALTPELVLTPPIAPTPITLQEKAIITPPQEGPKPTKTHATVNAAMESAAPATTLPEKVEAATNRVRGRLFKAVKTVIKENKSKNKLAAKTTPPAIAPNMFKKAEAANDKNTAIRGKNAAADERNVIADSKKKIALLPPQAAAKQSK